MVMTTMVIIIPPTTATASSKGDSHDRRGVPVATTRAMAATGGGWRLRAGWSVAPTIRYFTDNNALNRA
jgi:hypothetical protein